MKASCIIYSRLHPTATTTFRSPKNEPSQPFKILPSISSPYLNQKANRIMNFRIEGEQGKMEKKPNMYKSEPHPQSTRWWLSPLSNTIPSS